MIIFLGIAGSGKSTMGQLLATSLKCPWISTGNLLRQQMDSKTQAVMLEGKIISNEQTIEVLSNEFKRLNVRENQAILDGSPRTMRQAEWLVEMASQGELKINAVIHLDVSKDVAKKRLLARRRPDDYEEAINERFAEYASAIVPIIDYFKKQGITVYNVDSSRTPQQIEQDIEKDLGV